MRLRALVNSGLSVTLMLGAASALAEPDEQDGPAPVNTSASLSAGADLDVDLRSRDGDVARTSDGHPLGAYGGVVPGASVPPPAPPNAVDQKPVITWPGFQMRPDGTSRVFIQSTVSLAPQSSAAPGKFNVVLPGAKVLAGTNRLPLETRFFNTPVSRVNIAVQREAVTVSLDLRADVTPVVSTERGPTGYYFVYIDLPKGSFLSAAASSQAPAAPAKESPLPGAVKLR